MSFEIFTASQAYKRKSPNLIRLGFDFDADHESEYYKIQGMLYQLYHIKCESSWTLQKMFNFPSVRTPTDMLRLFDVEIRDLSEANKVSLEQNRSNVPTGFTSKQTWHTTWDRRQVFLRSSYEQTVANQLDSEKTKYEVEALRIRYFDTQQQKFRIAIPDFYLPDSNTIIEVKADHWLDEINMEDKKKSYSNMGFNFKLWLDGQYV